MYMFMGTSCHNKQFEREGGTQHVNSRQKRKAKPHPQDIPRGSASGVFAGEAAAGCFLTGEGEGVEQSLLLFLDLGGPIPFEELVPCSHW